MMADLKATLSHAAPEAGLAPPLAALWWAAKGDWDAAHKIVQDESDTNAAWVHAYLTGSRATSAMPAIGIGGRASRRQRIHSTPSGSGSFPR
jgi:hypothetical protein